MAKAYSTTPSSLLGIDEDPLAAFCFDRAAFTFGGALEAELNNIEGRTKKESETKQDRVLRRWLPDNAIAKKFADPGARRKTS